MFNTTSFSCLYEEDAMCMYVCVCVCVCVRVCVRACVCKLIELQDFMWHQHTDVALISYLCCQVISLDNH